MYIDSIGTFSSTTTRDTLIRFREKKRRMVSVKEELKPRRIRVFKWNEKLPPEAIEQEEGHCWIFLLKIKNRFITKIPGQNKDEELIRENKMSIYSNPSFSSSSRRNREAILRAMYTELMDMYFPEVDKHLVQRVLSRLLDYLSFNFRFDAQTLLRPNGPMIVFVVEADRTRTVEYGQHDVDTNRVVDPSNLFPPDYLSAKSSDCLRRNRTASSYAVNDEEIKDFYSYNSDLLNVLFTLRDYLEVKLIFPTIKLVEDEPSGLVEVKPQPALLTVQVCDLASLPTACPICLEGLSNGKDLMQTLCLHIFHGECISKWLSRAESCPICRFGPLAPLPSWSPSSNDMGVDQSPQFQNLMRLRQQYAASGLEDVLFSLLPGSRTGNGEAFQYSVLTERTGNGETIQYNCPCGEGCQILLLRSTGNGECVQHKCSCGKGLHILLTGEGCYYKLLLTRRG